MSLFLVNRYLGEEEEGEDGSVPEERQSQVLLAKLQKKAKEKLRPKGDPSEEETPQHRVKKKRKAAEDERPEPGSNKKKKPEAASSSELLINGEPVDVGQKKKKKNSTGSGSVPVVGEAAQKDGTESAAAVNEQPHRTAEKTCDPKGFAVVGGCENKPVQKVHRVLPQWLAQPDQIHRDIKNHLVPVSGLCASLLTKLQNNGIQHFFPVQAEVIPAILESTQKGLLLGHGGYKPRDLCVSAPTGSGKTLAFVVPVVQVLMERVVCEVRALAVLPTKELAQQVFRVFTSYAEGTPLKVVMLAGQKSFASEEASLSELRGGHRRSLADIVVATPGRLVDHISRNSGFSLDHLRFLIIDEADRMIDSMHQSWLSRVVNAVYKSRSDSRAASIFRRKKPLCATAASLSPPQPPLQKLLFSATLTQNPEKLQQLDLHQPRLFSSIHGASAPTARRDAFDFPQGLTEFYVPCTMSKKPLLILHFILRMKLSPILCFTNSRETAHRLFLVLQLFGGIDVAEFSSRLSPGERKKKLKEFEQGKIQLLVSTDAAARGIDIKGVKSVVNYDAPQFIRTYIHRIGRTARAGKAGLAFTFLLGVQEKNFLQMVTDAGSPGIQRQIVKPENLKSMEAQYEGTLQKLAEVIQNKN